MNIKTLETWTWRLIFGGLITASLSIFVMEQDATLGAVLATVGSVATVVGVVMVWWRSRLNDPTEKWDGGRP
jgi:hypothetical protein